MSGLETRELDQEGVGGVIGVRDVRREVNVDRLVREDTVLKVLAHGRLVSTALEGHLDKGTTIARNGASTAHATVTEAVVDGSNTPVSYKNGQSRSQREETHANGDEIEGGKTRLRKESIRMRRIPGKPRGTLPSWKRQNLGLARTMKPLDSDLLQTS